MSDRIQCQRCKVKLTCDKFKKKRDDTYTKTCIQCLDKHKTYMNEQYKCEHGKRKTDCKECHGGSVCDHGITRTRCRECGGGTFCSHDKRRSECKECEGGSVCDHGKVRSRCKECDLSGYLCKNIRWTVTNALKKNKELHSIKYLDCDIKTFKEHIEKQFKEGMVWENHGEWHIDHIIPLKYKQDGKEPTLEEVIERLHYTNTQPMWAEENMSKGNRFIG